MQAEIVTIQVIDGKIVGHVMKAPGLPDGFHDLFCDSGDARIAEMEKALRDAKRNHLACDDPWYTCPMHPEGCADSSREKDECTCGAEEHNAKIDNALMESVTK